MKRWPLYLYLVVFFGVGAVLIARRASAGGPLSKEIERTLPLEATGRVSLQTHKGTVKVRPWNRMEVGVHARVEADDSCASESIKAERVRDIEVRIEGFAGDVRIATDTRRLHRTFEVFCTSDPFVHYQISLPATARLQIVDHKSDIQVADMRSDVEVETHKGRVDLRGLDGPLSLETHKGEARVAFARLSHASRLETYKGEIEVLVPRSAGFQIDGEARHGRIKSDFELPEGSIERGRRSQRIHAAINGGGPQLNLSTNKGSIYLRQL